MWRSRKAHPTPERDGIYVVARFVDGRMVDWSTNYGFLKERGGWFSNSGDPTNFVPAFTHWMPYSEYRDAIAAVPREADDVL